MVLFLGGEGALAQVPIIGYKSLDDFVLVSVPLYILMSQILLTGKVGNDLFELANKWLCHLPGGLGVATVIACAIFAAITGSSVACAVTIGAIAIPEMLSRGYDRRLVLGTVAAGGTLGILIPPSIPMILYGAITDESVGKLFMSGVVPGVLLMFLFICIVVYSSRNLERHEPAPWSERLSALRKSIWGLLLPVIVVGGIYTGAFTPTEAAGVGTVYSLFITFFIYRTLTLKDMPGILNDTVQTSCMIFAIMIGASLFGFVLTILDAPQALTNWVAASIWEMGGLRGHQYSAPLPGVHSGIHFHHLHHPADPLPAHHAARLRSHLVQRGDAPQSGAGAHHAAGGHEPLRSAGRQPREQDDGYHPRRRSLRMHDGAGDPLPLLLPRSGDVAAERAEVIDKKSRSCTGIFSVVI